jgi:putative ABC transport system ATP-binding protein
MPAILETRDLQKQFESGELSVEALRGIRLQVQAGEFLAIMGPSGSGKSTLLHLLGALDVASEGEVLLHGDPLTQLNDDERARIRRRQIGFIFQSFNLLPTLTASENVALPLLLDGQNPKVALERAHTALALVDLSARAGHRPDQLSGGEQQRVAIARALASKPQIVLADEPTGNLDRAAGERLLQILRRACDEDRQTIVMVTHDPYAASCADRVVFLIDGKLSGELSGPQLSLSAISETLAGIEGG